jgi:hypothetical protein
MCEIITGKYNNLIVQKRKSIKILKLLLASLKDLYSAFNFYILHLHFSKKV